MELAFIAIFVVTCIVGAAAYNYYRKKMVMQVAEEMGLEFLPHANLLGELNGCELMTNAGRKEKCINCFGGEADGISFKVFEYRFTTGYGKRQTLHTQTVTYINAANLDLPEFSVQPKSFLGNLFGGKPVNCIDLDPEFSKSYSLSTVEPVKVRPLFTEQVKNLIRGNRWSVESNRGRLLVYRVGKTVNHKQLKHFLSESLNMHMQLEEASLARMASPQTFASPITTPVSTPIQ